jgi:nucleoside-diphosphate-sugar epimerase
MACASSGTREAVVKRVLLLGGTGYIGSRVLSRLRARSDVRTMVLAHKNVDYSSLEDVNLVVDSLTRWDLSWLEIFDPDTIIHVARLGGSGRVRRAIASRRGRRANQRIVDWLSARAPWTRVIYVSGTLVYGDRGDADVDEGASLQPTAFAREYIRAERPWMDAQRDGALPVTIVRPPWVVGPGSWLQAHYVRPARRHGEVPVYGSGENWMTLLDVDDCAGAILHLAEHAQPPMTVNLFAPGQWIRQRDFADALADLLGTPVRRVDVRDRGLLRDRAVGEALTFSLRATTSHPSALDGYVWAAPRWADMLARHVSAS